jgi:hypothetical protein
MNFLIRFASTLSIIALTIGAFMIAVGIGSMVGGEIGIVAGLIVWLALFLTVFPL